MRVGRALLGIGVGVGIALTYTHQQIALIETGYAMEQRAQLKADLLDQYRILLYNVVVLQAPQRLEARLAQRAMEWVSPRQVTWLASPPVALPSRGPMEPWGWMAWGRWWVARVLTPRATAEAQPGP